jgi:hypothetical protein
LICLPDSCEPVRDRDGGYLAFKLCQCFDDGEFRLSIEGTRCFVENEEFGSGVKSSRNTKALTLPTRKFEATLTNPRVETLSMFGEEVCKVGAVERFPYQ